MRHQKILSLRALALALSLALAMIGLITWAPLGHAADPTSPVVDKTKQGSITVHSIAGDPITSAKRDGTEITNISGEKLKGSKFKLQKHDNIDVSTLDGMKTAKGITAETFKQDSSFGASGFKECTTDQNGSCKFDGLFPGVYKLVQVEAPAGHQTAIPSIVVLPLTNPEGTGFMYDIHVYPKNAKIGSITKTNDTAEGTLLKEGSTMDFTIKVPIPKKERQTLKSFTVTDKPVSGLELTEASITEVKVEDDTAMTKGNGKDYTVSTADKNVTVTFLEAGLSKLNAAASKKNLIVKVEGKVKNIETATDNTVKNSASYKYTFSDGTGGGNETPDSDQPKVKFGYIKIKNIDGSNNSELNGAKFKVGKCAAGDKSVSKTEAEIVATDVTAKTAIGPIGSLANARLCVEQTLAPQGYALNPEAKAVEFGDSEVASATKASPMEITITNTNANDFLQKLPLTGGPGVIAFLVGGALLLVAAVTTMVRKRRQDQE